MIVHVPASDTTAAAKVVKAKFANTGGDNGAREAGQHLVRAI
jgi:hypothetical protein